MRASTAYFVGAGTIVVAIAIGLGGGIVAGNIMNPIAPKQGPDTGKMAQRAEAAPAPVTTNAAPERVQYINGTQAFGTVVAAPAQAEAKPEVKPEPQTTQANAEPPSQAAAVEPPKSAPTTPAPISSASISPAPVGPPQAAKPVEQRAAIEPSNSPDNAYAKARDSDVKRAASERRRAERRERWADRNRYESREQRGTRDRTDWDDVARNVREDSESRDIASRPRGGSPRIMLFGPDDD